ncbi:NAD(P)-binding domain-containing protein [Gordonia sp. N1V]|uniref:NAD(P)-binding domain-containing protein n=1 Tax=Gordonia sp. N1V TaxID=3034163 RepID=UPI0023E1FF0F|nr:NAD(P)-binding domain-containing protein [Gordonia sp. N1V]MDF3282812.1 NAD(P)-binding domain-containing protein [Gordonia sp. N1V]
MHTDTDVLVIGGGQAGLSAAYFLERFGLHGRYRLLDHSPSPGGAWQYRWPTLTLAAANHVHDLPGYGLVEALGVECDQFPAATAVPDYFGRYEEKFGLTVARPVHVRAVHRDGDGFRASIVAPDEHGERRETEVTTRTLINATGTWDRPFIPHIPGIGDFRGRQLHTHDYTRPEEFAGQRVLVVGAGISAIQLLIEIARNAPEVTTFWCSRTEPHFRDGPFTPEEGRAAVARVEERVRAGLPPTSVVSVTGLSLTPAIAAARRDGILRWRPMFTRITETGVCWDCGSGDLGVGDLRGGDLGDGTELDVDVLFWNTGFRSALDHLAPLHLRAPGGGITMTGRLATTVAADPRIQLLGYGPSASTIGANRAGREAARVIVDLLDAS